MNKLTSTLLACCALLTATSNAAAVTLYGADVSFTIKDSDYLSSYFGPANVVGNSIFFQPTDFKAESLNGAGAATLDQTLIIKVQATTVGYDMTSFLLAEQGNYQLTGTSSSVIASGSLDVVSQTTTCGVLTCRDGNNIFNTTGLDTVGSLTEWGGVTSVNLADTIGWGSDTYVSLSLTNLLTANAPEAGDSAMIQKTFGAVGITINPVPVPAALWLFGSGLIGIAAFAKRKKT